MKLRKHSETQSEVTRDWLTIYVGDAGTKRSPRFSLYTKHQMPDSVEVNWAPPITNQEEPSHEIPAVPVHHLPDVNPDPGSTQDARPAPQAHVTFSADPSGTAY